MAERVCVRELDDDEGQRLLRIIRRGTGSVVTWRQAQMVLLSAQIMAVAKIAEVTFASADRVRDVIRNFNADGFDSLYPKYKGGRPRTFTQEGPRRAPLHDRRRRGHTLSLVTADYRLAQRITIIALCPIAGGRDRTGCSREKEVGVFPAQWQ